MACSLAQQTIISIEPISLGCPATSGFQSVACYAKKLSMNLRDGFIPDFDDY